MSPTATQATYLSSPPHYTGDINDLYEAGAMRNIAAFYRQVVEGQFANDTGSRAVDGVLTAILGREAAMRRTQLSMDDLLLENRHSHWISMA